jgi:hypothetical protein
MARRVEPRGSGTAVRLLLVVAAVLVLWFVVNAVLGMVFSLIRAALFIGLFVVVAWVVLVGPPGRRD